MYGGGFGATRVPLFAGEAPVAVGLVIVGFVAVGWLRMYLVAP